MFQISENSVVGQYARQTRSSRALNISFWILQGVLAAVFLVAGITKLASLQVQVATFDEIGLGQWLRYSTGGLEVIGAILVLVPRTAGLAAILLGMTMVGAVDVHLLITGGSPVAALVLLAMAIAVTWYQELYLKRRK